MVNLTVGISGQDRSISDADRHCTQISITSIDPKIAYGTKILVPLLHCRKKDLAPFCCGTPNTHEIYIRDRSLLIVWGGLACIS